MCSQLILRQAERAAEEAAVLLQRNRMLEERLQQSVGGLLCAQAAELICGRVMTERDAAVAQNSAVQQQLAEQARQRELAEQAAQAASHKCAGCCTVCTECLLSPPDYWLPP